MTSYPPCTTPNLDHPPNVVRHVELSAARVERTEAIDLDRARAFSESEDLRKKMQETGVADKPDF